MIRTGVFMVPFAAVVLLTQRLDPGARPGILALAVIAAGYLAAQAVAQRVPALAMLLLIGAALLAGNLLGLGPAWPG